MMDSKDNGRSADDMIGVDVEMLSATEAKHRRVKLYIQNDVGRWVDLGTGYAHLVTQGEPSLVVRHQDDNRVMMNTSVSGKSFNFDFDSIITWRMEDNAHYALSFQTKSFSKDVADFINAASTQEEDGEDHPLSQLTMPAFATVGKITDILERAVSLKDKQILAQECANREFLRKWGEVFYASEDLGEEKILKTMYHGVKRMFLLSCSKLIERLISPEFWNQTFGCLQYDSFLPQSQWTNHRHFLKDCARFSEPVPYNNEELVERIHFNYRLMYVKDVVLSRVLDDPAFATLNTMIYTNTSFILSKFLSPNLLDALCKCLSEDFQCLVCVHSLLFHAKSFMTPLKRDELYRELISRGLFETVLKYMNGDCSGAQLWSKWRKESINHWKERFKSKCGYNDTGQENADEDSPNNHNDTNNHTYVNDIDDKADLLYPAPNAMSVCVEILSFCVMHNAQHLRNFIIEEHRHKRSVPLSGGSSVVGDTKAPSETLMCIIKVMIHSQDQGIQAQCCDILTQILNLEGVSELDKDDCLLALYDHGAIELMVQAISNRPSPQMTPEQEENLNFAKQLICEILSFCVQKHTYRIKYYVLRHNVAEKVSKLCGRQPRHVALAAIRYLRACVALEDDFYNKYLAKNCLFYPVIELLKSTLGRTSSGKQNGGLIQSSLLSLFDVIASKKVKTLVQHICQNFMGDVESLSQDFPTFERLLVCHKHNLEVTEFPPSRFPGGRPVGALNGSSVHRNPRKPPPGV
eukprot:GHVL01034007.1.p1 GENE.GHVL01034007.1~~GHVL01034007.1.p1  ORF type:complete len:749 (+),score=91.88 GHVL01034007.1:46-2292(+)